MKAFTLFLACTFVAFCVTGSVSADAAVRANGSCGTSASALSDNAPVSNLCASGNSTEVEGIGPWTWQCLGTGGGSPSVCTTALAAKGIGNASAKTPELGGAPGTASLGAVSVVPVQRATYDVSNVPESTPQLHPFDDETSLQNSAGFQEYKTSKAFVPISGGCGEAASKVLTAAPNTNLCATGTATSVTGSGPWAWACVGSYGGASTACKAPFLGRLTLTPEVTLSTVLLSQDQRLAVGIKDGPDSPTDFYTAKNGVSYIMSSGSAYQDGLLVSGTYELHVDPQMTTTLALNSNAPPGAGDLRVLLTDHASECKPGNHKLKLTDPGGLACSEYFDRDYAGGGTYFRCPDGQTSVYFFHGENHTPPDGSTNHAGGWSGNGVAYFNNDETVLTRATQMPTDGGTTSAEIDGMNMSNAWIPVGTAFPNPPQAQMYSDAASVAPSPDGTSIYVYHGDATLNSQYNPAFCSPGGCAAVSAAPVAAFCQNIQTQTPVQFSNYYEGQFSQAAALGSGALLGYGSGGLFTPMYLDTAIQDHGGSTTYIASKGLYVTLRLATNTGAGGESIDARFSVDGVTWTTAQILLGPPTGITPFGDGEQLMYPKFHVISDGGSEQYVLTYSLVTAQDFWKWAELIRVPVEFNF